MYQGRPGGAADDEEFILEFEDTDDEEAGSGGKTATQSRSGQGDGTTGLADEIAQLRAKISALQQHPFSGQAQQQQLPQQQQQAQALEQAQQQLGAVTCVQAAHLANAAAAPSALKRPTSRAKQVQPASRPRLVGGARKPSPAPKQTATAVGGKSGLAGQSKQLAPQQEKQQALQRPLSQQPQLPETTEDVQVENKLMAAAFLSSIQPELQATPLPVAPQVPNASISDGRPVQQQGGEGAGRLPLSAGGPAAKQSAVSHAPKLAMPRTTHAQASGPSRIAPTSSTGRGAAVMGQAGSSSGQLPSKMIGSTSQGRGVAGAGRGRGGGFPGNQAGPGSTIATQQQQQVHSGRAGGAPRLLSAATITARRGASSEVGAGHPLGEDEQAHKAQLKALRAALDEGSAGGTLVAETAGKEAWQAGADGLPFAKAQRVALAAGLLPEEQGVRETSAARDGSALSKHALAQQQPSGSPSRHMQLDEPVAPSDSSGRGSGWGAGIFGREGRAGMSEEELECRAQREYLLIKQEILAQQQRQLQWEWAEAEARFGRTLGVGSLSAPLLGPAPLDADAEHQPAASSAPSLLSNPPCDSVLPQLTSAADVASYLEARRQQLQQRSVGVGKADVVGDGRASSLKALLDREGSALGSNSKGREGRGSRASALLREGKEASMVSREGTKGVSKEVRSGAREGQQCSRGGGKELTRRDGEQRRGKEHDLEADRDIRGESSQHARKGGGLRDRHGEKVERLERERHERTGKERTGRSGQQSEGYGRRVREREHSYRDGVNVGGVQAGRQSCQRENERHGVVLDKGHGRGEKRGRLAEQDRAQNPQQDGRNVRAKRSGPMDGRQRREPSKSRSLSRRSNSSSRSHSPSRHSSSSSWSRSSSYSSSREGRGDDDEEQRRILREAALRAARKVSAQSDGAKAQQTSRQAGQGKQDGPPGASELALHQAKVAPTALPDHPMSALTPALAHAEQVARPEATSARAEEEEAERSRTAAQLAAELFQPASSFPAPLASCPPCLSHSHPPSHRTTTTTTTIPLHQGSPCSPYVPLPLSVPPSLPPFPPPPSPPPLPPDSAPRDQEPTSLPPPPPPPPLPQDLLPPLPQGPEGMLMQVCEDDDMDIDPVDSEGVPAQAAAGGAASPLARANDGSGAESKCAATAERGEETEGSRGTRAADQEGCPASSLQATMATLCNLPSTTVPAAATQQPPQMPTVNLTPPASQQLLHSQHKSSSPPVPSASAAAPLPQASSSPSTSAASPSAPALVPDDTAPAQVPVGTASAPSNTVPAPSSAQPPSNAAHQPSSVPPPACKIIAAHSKPTPVCTVPNSHPAPLLPPTSNPIHPHYAVTVLGARPPSSIPQSTDSHLPSGAASIPSSLRDCYASPLTQFRAYRLSPQYFKLGGANPSPLSPSLAHVVDPVWPLCVFDVRGACKDPGCPMQHLRDGMLPGALACGELRVRMAALGIEGALPSQPRAAQSSGAGRRGERDRRAGRVSAAAAAAAEGTEALSEEVTAALAAAVTSAATALSSQGSTGMGSLAAQVTACKDAGVLALLQSKGGRLAQVPLEKRARASLETDVPVYQVVNLVPGTTVKPSVFPRSFRSQLLASVPAPTASPWQLTGYGHGYPLPGLDWLSMSSSVDQACVLTDESAVETAPGGARQDRYFSALAPKRPKSKLAKAAGIDAPALMAEATGVLTIRPSASAAAASTANAVSGNTIPAAGPAGVPAAAAAAAAAAAGVPSAGADVVPVHPVPSLTSQRVDAFYQGVLQKEPAYKANPVFWLQWAAEHLGYGERQHTAQEQDAAINVLERGSSFLAKLEGIQEQTAHRQQQLGQTQQAQQGPCARQQGTPASTSVLLPMKLGLLARQHGLTSSHPDLVACKVAAWQALCSEQQQPGSESDPYAVCLALVSVEPNARRQCVVLHRGMGVCAARYATSVARRQLQQDSDLTEQQTGGEQPVHSLKVIAEESGGASMACALDLALRLMYVSCSAGYASVAAQLLSQLQHASRLHPQCSSPQLPEPSDSHYNITSHLSTMSDSAHAQQPANPPSLSLRAPSLPAQPFPTDDIHSLERSAEGAAATHAMAAALASCPSSASILWLCAAHIAQHSTLPPEPIRRLGYPQLPMQVCFEAPAAQASVAAPQPPAAPTSPPSPAQGAPIVAMSDQAWSHLEAALECACRAVEGAVAAWVNPSGHAQMRTATQVGQQLPRHQAQQQGGAPSARHQPHPEPGVAVAAQLASVVLSALSYQRVLLHTAQATTSHPQQQQPHSHSQPKQQRQPHCQNPQPSSPHWPSGSSLLPLVFWWLAQPGDPCCASRLASLPHQAKYWLGPKYAAAVSEALHATGLPKASTAASVPPTNPSTSTARGTSNTPVPSSQPAVALTAPSHRHALLLVSGVCLSAGLVAAAAADCKAVACAPGLVAAAAADCKAVACAPGLLPTAKVPPSSNHSTAAFSGDPISTPPVTVFDLLWSAVELYCQVASTDEVASLVAHATQDIPRPPKSNQEEQVSQQAWKHAWPQQGAGQAEDEVQAAGPATDLSPVRQVWELRVPCIEVVGLEWLCYCLQTLVLQGSLMLASHVRTRLDAATMQTLHKQQQQQSADPFPRAVFCELASVAYKQRAKEHEAAVSHARAAVRAVQCSHTLLKIQHMRECQQLQTEQHSSMHSSCLHHAQGLERQVLLGWRTDTSSALLSSCTMLLAHLGEKYQQSLSSVPTTAPAPPSHSSTLPPHDPAVKLSNALRRTKGILQQEVLSVLAHCDQEPSAQPLHMRPSVLAPLFGPSLQPPPCTPPASSKDPASGTNGDLSGGPSRSTVASEPTLKRSQVAQQGQQEQLQQAGSTSPTVLPCQEPGLMPVLSRKATPPAAAPVKASTRAVAPPSLQPSAGPTPAAGASLALEALQHCKLRLALYPPDLGHIQAAGEALSSACLPFSDVAVQALETLISCHPTSPATIQPLLSFASSLLAPPLKPSTPPSTAAAAPARSSQAGATASSLHVSSGRVASGGPSSTAHQSGSIGSRTQWCAPSTLGWLSWVLPLLAGQLAHTQPTAPPEDWQLAIKLTRIFSPRAAAELCTAALHAHPNHVGLWDQYNNLGTAAVPRTMGSAASIQMGNNQGEATCEARGLKFS